MYHPSMLICLLVAFYPGSQGEPEYKAILLEAATKMAFCWDKITLKTLQCTRSLCNSNTINPVFKACEVPLRSYNPVTIIA